MVKLFKNTRVLLLTSYCDEDGIECTNETPCVDCLAMCNVFVLNQDSNATYLKELNVGEKP